MEPPPRTFTKAGFTFTASTPSRILPSTRLAELESQYAKPALPDMIFPHFVSLSTPSGVSVSIDAQDSLKFLWTVDSGFPCPVGIAKVAAAEEWLAGALQERGEDDAALKVHREYDWTWHTIYVGTVRPEERVREAQGEKMDWVLLSDRKEKILFFAECTLYEDELADNGCTRCSVRIVGVFGGANG